jgi:hypothetical protein
MQAEDQLDPTLACLFFSKWASNNHLAMKADEALALQSTSYDRLATLMPARAMSAPNPLPTVEELLLAQPALSSCGDKIVSDGDLSSVISPAKETAEKGPAGAKPVKQTQQAAITKGRKKWDEIREKR